MTTSQLIFRFEKSTLLRFLIWTFPSKPPCEASNFSYQLIQSVAEANARPSNSKHLQIPRSQGWLLQWFFSNISQSGGFRLIRREETVSNQQEYQHFQQRSCLLWILSIDEGLAVYTFSVPCLQCLYNSQLPEGQSILWFKEATNAKDIIKQHSRAIKRRQLGEKVEEKVLKVAGGFMLFVGQDTYAPAW